MTTLHGPYPPADLRAVGFPPPGEEIPAVPDFATTLVVFREAVDELIDEVQLLNQTARDLSPVEFEVPASEKLSHAEAQALGWAHAFFCVALDKGEDPRLGDLSEYIEQAERDLRAVDP